jgi:hypothetical protein
MQKTLSGVEGPEIELERMTRLDIDRGIGQIAKKLNVNASLDQECDHLG